MVTANGKVAAENALLFDLNGTTLSRGQTAAS